MTIDSVADVSGVRTDKRRFGVVLSAALAALLVAVAVGAASAWWWRDARDAAAAAEAKTKQLPDWGGLWTVDRDPKHPWGIGDPKWKPEIAKQVEQQNADDKAGKPHNIYIDCLPEGMPSFVVMTLAAFEFLFTPGRVTIVSEFDGNRQRHIYTDGRPHPSEDDLEPTFNGHSIGHWEGDALVVDTVGLFPQNYLPLGQSIGVPNNGDLHIEERIYPTGPDRLRFELVVHAPHVLTEPWHVSRNFKRLPDRKAELVEGSCRQGDFVSARDAHGNYIWAPIAHDPGGAPLPQLTQAP